MAMGFDVLSMNATNLPKVKSVIRGITFDRAKQLLAEVMSMSNGDQIRDHIAGELRDTGLTRLIRPVTSDSN